MAQVLNFPNSGGSSRKPPSTDKEKSKVKAILNEIEYVSACPWCNTTEWNICFDDEFGTNIIGFQCVNEECEFYLSLKIPRELFDICVKAAED